MTNTVAAWMAGLILVAMGADYILNGGEIMFSLALRLASLLDWMAFWR